jgi:hypothetical protein
MGTGFADGNGVSPQAQRLVRAVLVQQKPGHLVPGCPFVCGDGILPYLFGLVEPALFLQLGRQLVPGLRIAGCHTVSPYGPNDQAAGIQASIGGPLT